MYRQGDVLIIPINDEIKDYEEIDRDQDRIVLAYGEATGHAHAIKSKDAILVKVNDKIILMAFKPVILSHEEHSAIHLPMGNFLIKRQREYTPEGLRNVTD